MLFAIIRRFLLDVPKLTVLPDEMKFDHTPKCLLYFRSPDGTAVRAPCKRCTVYELISAYVSS